MRRLSYSGGEALQTKLQEILKKIRNQPEVKVGFLSGATYPDGTPVAMVAAVHNYGAPGANVPARPFFSNMVRDRSPNWGRNLGEMLKKTDYDAKNALALMGEGIGSQLQQAIKDFDSVPLSDSTKARKGFDTQLIDTAHMINSVGYQVDGQDKVKLPVAAQGRADK